LKISNREIKNFIIASLVADTAINDYCNSKFAKTLMILSGIDVTNPPKETDYPVFSIDPLQKDIGESNSDFTYQLLTHLAIAGDDKPLIAGDVVEFTGIDLVEELADLITDNLKKSFSEGSNLEMFDITFYHDEITAFPTYSGAIAITFEVPNVIGCDKITFN